MRDGSVVRPIAFIACLQTALAIGALAVAACSGGTTSATSPTGASPSMTIGAGPTAWASPRPAVWYARSKPPSTEAGSTTPHTTARVRKAGTIGWEFVPTVDVRVTELGCFDAGRDGLARSHRVGIFDEETGRILASVTVGPESRLDGFFRWEPFETPLVLTAGRSYLVGTEDRKTLETAYSWHDFPYEGDGPPPGEHWADEIGYGTRLFASSVSEDAFTAPTVMQDLWTCPPWFSPNIRFSPVSSAMSTQ
jgi:hypothetical protein